MHTLAAMKETLQHPPFSQSTCCIPVSGFSVFLSTSRVPEESLLSCMQSDFTRKLRDRVGRTDTNLGGFNQELIKRVLWGLASVLLHSEVQFRVFLICNLYSFS